jgi:hypothetical protein
VVENPCYVNEEKRMNKGGENGESDRLSKEGLPNE